MPSLFRARRLWAVGLSLNLLAAVACAQNKAGTAGEPAARGQEGPWMQMHQRFLERAKEGKIDLLFLGDSITQGWNTNDAWKRHYGPRHAANFGIGGDRTQHVLWRLENGEIAGIRPKVVVLMIGTNNIGSNTTDEIAEAVGLIVAKLRKDLPETKVLLLGIFPRGKDRNREQTETEPDPRVAEINDRIKGLADGKGVIYQDIGRAFLDAEGRIPKDLMYDFLHLTEKGYRAWADAIEPTLWDLMDEERFGRKAG